jgi:hypothetical protein
MDVEYSIIISDLEALQKYILEYVPYGKKQISNSIRNTACSAAILLIVGFLLWEPNRLFAIYFFVLSAVLVFFTITGKAQVKGRVAKFIREQYKLSTENTYVGKHDFSITPEFVIDIDDTGEEKRTWNSVYGLGVTDQHIFIVLKPGLNAFIVPKRAFPDDASFNQFFETARKYKLAVSNSPPAA